MSCGGYIKLYRKSLRSPMWRNLELWRFWEWCLLKAAYEPTMTFVKFKEVALQPGQLIFGRRMAHHETGLSEQTVRTCVRTLSSGKRPAIAIRSHRTFSIITVLHWAEYQNGNTMNHEQPACPPTHDQPPDHQRPATLNKKHQEEKEDISAFDFLKTTWLDSTGYPSLSPGEARALGKWAADVEAGEFPREGVPEVIRNALADESMHPVDLWRIYNNRNRHLPRRKEGGTGSRRAVIEFACRRCDERECVLWTGDRPRPERRACPAAGCGGEMVEKKSVPPPPS